MTTIALADLTGAEIRAGGFDKAVLPVGATEFHGDHLPYGTDTLTAEALARRFAADLGGMLLLPSIAYGPSAHHLAFPWTISIQPATPFLRRLDANGWRPGQWLVPSTGDVAPER
jgi:creatinine amidohydrolase